VVGAGAVLAAVFDQGDGTARRTELATEAEPATEAVEPSAEPTPPVAVLGATDPAGTAPTWRQLDPGPVRDREGHSVTWTGDELIVFGGVGEPRVAGEQPVGAAYRPSTGAWRALAEPPLTPRADHVAAWTGEELLVWGGHDGSFTYAPDDGAAYDPTTDTWRAIAPAPLPADAYEAVWTGDELVVLGGGEAAVHGAAYVPATDTWRAITVPPVALVHPRLVWTGDEVVAVGGTRTTSSAVEQFTAWAWHPTTDAWHRLGGARVPSQAVEATWTGGSLVVWGHSPSQEGTWVFDGAAWRQADGFPIECEDRIVSIAQAGGVVGAFCGRLASFAPSTGVWSEMTLPPGGVDNGLLVAADGALFVFDGGIPAGSVHFPPGIEPSFAELAPAG
jgi:hypothetical protein